MIDDKPSPTNCDAPLAARGWRWWVRAVEVRMRFVLLVLAMLIVTSQWSRLRGAWDDWRQAMWGDRRTASVSGDKEYFCPMDPGVVSIWPAICPICNMDLVQRQKHDAQILPEGTIARMQLSPYRIQLAGIRTAEIRPRELVEEIPVAGTITAEGDGSFRLNAAMSRSDRELLTQPRMATLRRMDPMSETVDVMLHPVDVAVNSRSIFRFDVGDKTPDWLSAGTSVSGWINVPVTAANPVGERQAGLRVAPLAIPESALVDHGARQIVFVESMPGMFDAREVILGRRTGDWYPVLQGLKAGERIAETGAFLIDAETRLNPSLAIAYFGANQANSASRAPEIKLVTDKAVQPTILSAEDAALAKAQSTCPVTGLSLNSMGGPVLVTVEGRKVFLCCKGCEGKLKSEPAKYLAKLPPP